MQRMIAFYSNFGTGWESYGYIEFGDNLREDYQ